MVDGDIDALYQLQQYQYQHELEEQAKTGAYTPDGYRKPLSHPSMATASDESRTMTGWAKAKGYEIASPFLDLFGMGPPTMEALNQQESDLTSR